MNVSLEQSINQLELNNEKSVIKDIDLPLYKYGLLFRYDINNYFDSDINRRKQKFKYYAINIWLLINILRACVSLTNVENGTVPKYYFDFLPYFGGIPEFLYSISIFEVSSYTYTVRSICPG